MLGSSEPRKLGLVGKALVGLMVVATAGLLAETVVVVRAHHAEKARCAEVESFLDTFARADTVLLIPDAPPPQRATGDSRDPTGQEALRRSCVELDADRLSRRDEIQRSLERHKEWSFDLESDRFNWGLAALDPWGNAIYYRCPGPIHKNGWDLISCGPNGVFEEGQGDDIVVGEDLPGGIAAISSESGTRSESR